MMRLERRVDPADGDGEEADGGREWLVTNGLGGYASGTIAGVVTRRFHGLLIAALPVPLGRTMMLNHLDEVLFVGDQGFSLGHKRRPDKAGTSIVPARLAEFRLEQGLPVWRYEVDGAAVEKRLVMPHGQNTVVVTYRRTGGDAAAHLEVEPWINFRPHEGALDRVPNVPTAVTVIGDRFEIASESYPPLRVKLQGRSSAFRIDSKRIDGVDYSVERSRGYDATGALHSPGFFQVELPVGGTAEFLASTEVWDVALSVSPDTVLTAELNRRARLIARAGPVATEGFGAELTLAADQFVIIPVGRSADAARARARGDDIRTVIAGYHWFTEWGRDTMISLEGLALVTGRHAEAGFILRTFAHWVRDGLIPNLFPEGETAGLYHTADATLWFFHAIARYLEYSKDQETLEVLLPTLLDIAAHHEKGTRFGIGVDPEDGLLRQGQEGYQLTWMDAKVGDLVVTPRRGKPVEINALYYNALRLLESWTRQRGDDDRARAFAEKAERLKASYNERFWYAEGGYLYDVVDGEHGSDPSFRPNQLLAISLPHPVLDESRWRAVVEKIEERLVTPVGLRSLAKDDPSYKAKYFGDLRSRDLAYHQGTVWAWLVGPFIDAWVKVYPERRAEARRFLGGFERHLSEACVGQISEIFDAEPPYTARGCIAQAWSVAEVLRCLAMFEGRRDR
jgi:predicted glycogen debranching enzyme